MLHNERKRKDEDMKKVLSLSGGGGPLLAGPTESTAVHLNPCEWTTNMTKAWTGYRTTKNLTKTANQPAKLRGPVDPGFTMAEILLSLTIIGVVAAITLPSLTGNINERTWNTQRKALYARLSQAISLMPALNGYGLYNGTNSGGSVTVTDDTAAETFVTEGLSKVLKINNICDHQHLQDCGIPSKFTNFVGSVTAWPAKLSEMNPMFTETFTYVDVEAGTSTTFQNPQKNIDTKAAAFETINGESIAAYYNPQCVADLGETYWHYSQPKMCANFIYDLNGSKGPNTVGKDIGFITVLYPTDSVVVAPLPSLNKVSEQKNQSDAAKACTAVNAESRLPNREELSSLFYNRELLGLSLIQIWSSSRLSASEGWFFDFPTGGMGVSVQTNSGFNVFCIKR